MLHALPNPHTYVDDNKKSSSILGYEYERDI